MRFILSIYRVLLVIIVAVGLIGICFAMFAVLDPARVQDADASGPLLIISVLVFLILNAGAVSILLAIHDRHDELVNALTGDTPTVPPLAAPPEQHQSGESK